MPEPGASWLKLLTNYLYLTDKVLVRRQTKRITPEEKKNPRKSSVAGSDESQEYNDSQDDSVNTNSGTDYDESVKRLIDILDESIKSTSSADSCMGYYYSGYGR